jgi:hypothetical protein
VLALHLDRVVDGVRCRGRRGREVQVTRLVSEQDLDASERRVGDGVRIVSTLSHGCQYGCERGGRNTHLESENELSIREDGEHVRHVSESLWRDLHLTEGISIGSVVSSGDCAAGQRRVVG